MADRPGAPRWPDMTTPAAVELGRQAPVLRRPDAWERLKARVPLSWAEKVLEVLESCERGRMYGALVSTWVLREGRVAGIRTQREEHVR